MLPSSSKRKLSSAAPNPRDSRIRNIRQSAWFPSSNLKVQFARASVMVPCTFTRLVAKLDGSKVSFNRSEAIETILVAEDWKEGWEKSLRKEDYSTSGYIGRGTSKRVIYVCSPSQYYSWMFLLRLLTGSILQWGVCVGTVIWWSIFHQKYLRSWSRIWELGSRWGIPRRVRRTSPGVRDIITK